jgi:hypothetical protein
MKRKKIKTHLSDGIQEAVPKKKEENWLKIHLSDGIQEAVPTKKKRKRRKSV